MSRIEIVNEKDERRIVDLLVDKRELTGGWHWDVDDQTDTELVIRFGARRLPTPREQRDKKLRHVLSNLLRSFGHGADSNGPIMTDARTSIEAIFSEYPDRKESL